MNLNEIQKKVINLIDFFSIIRQLEPWHTKN